MRVGGTATPAARGHDLLCTLLALGRPPAYGGVRARPLARAAPTPMSRLRHPGWMGGRGGGGGGGGGQENEVLALLASLA